MSEAAAALRLELLGRRCPIPVIELAKHIGDVAVGDVVEVVSDDEAAKTDIAVWCRMKGQEFLGATPEAVGQAMRVRRLS